MDVERRLKRALTAVEDATSALKRAKADSGEDMPYVDRALRELDDAETHLRKAIREVP